MDELKFLVETCIDYQKDRVRLGNRLRSLPTDLKGGSFFKDLESEAEGLEEELKKRIEIVVSTEPLYTNYLKLQKGIGSMMASYLIAWLARDREFTVYVSKKNKDGTYMRRFKGKTEKLELPSYASVIEENLTAKTVKVGEKKEKMKKYIKIHMPPVMVVAENPSKIHKYCGLSPGSKRARGQKLTYNPKLKTLMWKILRQLLMAKGEWAQIYANDKAEYTARCPDPDVGSKKLKVHLTTKNIVMRKFITNFWIFFRKQRGLSVTEPYAVKMLRHTMVQPFTEKT